MSERSRHEFAIALAVALGLSLTVSSVPAQVPPSNKVQLKCQTGATKASITFVSSKLKCAQKCFGKARPTSGPFTGCLPPDYTDPKMNTCILDPGKGAEAKASAKIDKSCAAECPVCNDGVLCPDSAMFVTFLESALDFIGVQIYCREAANESPTKEEAKCEDAVGKSLVKFVGSKVKCFQNCVTREFKGKIPASSCTAGSPTDVATQECITKAETRAVASIDKVCVDVPGNPPCYTPGMSGADWVALGEIAVDAVTPSLYCGS